MSISDHQTRRSGENLSTKFFNYNNAGDRNSTLSVKSGENNLPVYLWQRSIGSLELAGFLLLQYVWQ